MKKKLHIFIILAVLGSALFGQELNRLLKRSTTDQIIMALEPTIKMDKDEILDDIATPVQQLSDDTFLLYISRSESMKPKKNSWLFMA